MECRTGPFARGPVGPGTKTLQSEVAAGSKSTGSPGKPASCAPSGRAEPACTGSRATWRSSSAWSFFLAVARAAGCQRERVVRDAPPLEPPVARSSLSGRDQQLADFADRAITTAPLRHVVGDVLDRLRGIRYGARQADALERRQVIQVVADERDLIVLESMFGAQAVDRGALVGRVAKDVVNVQFCRARMHDRAVFARNDRDSHARIAHPGETHAVARVELLQHF